MNALSGSGVQGQCRTLPPRARRNRPLAEWSKARAVELATQGHTYQQITDELGYANRGTVHRVVQQTLQTVQTEDVTELRALEVERLDALQRGSGTRRWRAASPPPGRSSASSGRVPGYSVWFRAFEGDRRGEEQSVQRGAVEPLPDERSGRYE